MYTKNEERAIKHFTQWMAKPECGQALAPLILASRESRLPEGCRAGLSWHLASLLLL